MCAQRHEHFFLFTSITTNSNRCASRPLVHYHKNLSSLTSVFLRTSFVFIISQELPWCLCVCVCSCQMGRLNFFRPCFPKSKRTKTNLLAQWLCFRFYELLLFLFFSFFRQNFRKHRFTRVFFKRQTILCQNILIAVV